MGRRRIALSWWGTAVVEIADMVVEEQDRKSEAIDKSRGDIDSNTLLCFSIFNSERCCTSGTLAIDGIDY